MSALKEDEIINLLNQELNSDALDDSSASETEDLVSEDDVQSDENYEPSDSEERYVSPLPNLSSDVDRDSPVSSNTGPAETRQSSIIQLPQRNVRGKNPYVWATTKGSTSTRTSMRNIVRTSRGPTRSCRGLTGELSCFEKFFTNEIFEEIVKWTNVEISVRRPMYKTVNYFAFLQTKAIEGNLFVVVMKRAPSIRTPRNHI